MDLIDKQILKELMIDSNNSLNNIGKKLNTSKVTISKRINNLKENKIIKDYSIKLNYKLLNFQEYNIFISLKNLSQKNQEELKNYFIESKYTSWIGKSFGKYDLKISLFVQNKNQLDIFINQLSTKFGHNFQRLDLLLIVDKFKASNENFLSNILEINSNNENQTKSTNSKKSKSKLNQFENLEKIDKKILRILNENPKISLVELSKQLNFELTAQNIKYRLKQLQKQNIFKGYSIVIDYVKKLNKISCLVLIDISPQTTLELKEYLKTSNTLSSFTENLGVWNFSITFFAKDLEELYQNLNKFRTKFSYSIRNFEYLIFFDFYKFPKIPQIVLE